ncbi:MAG: chemotaxis protein [Gammaproteobacteria bacterium]|nr:chemotaxis protein [Gammaproteobacteria bacterium]
MDSVDQRTQLVGKNRLELLLFRLQGAQRFGINVFKIREVIQCPALNRLPDSHPSIEGVITIRGITIPVINLRKALNYPAKSEAKSQFIIISEYNRSVHGFLVEAVERIINIKWETVMAPPKGIGKGSYMTAVTDIDGHLVEIIDVEKVLVEVTGDQSEVSQELLDNHGKITSKVRHVLVVEDSSVARKQIKRTLDSIDVESSYTCDGIEALEFLNAMIEDGGAIDDKLAMVIADIEMPRMDGYTLTKKIKEHPALKNVYVLLHTSLSGGFNEALVKKVGADAFIPKFQSDELATAIMERFSLLS